jgi:ribosome biogenesis protein BMS1
LVYAPFSGVGGIVYDKDAVYIELGGSHSHLKKKSSNQFADDQQPTTIYSNNAYVNSIIGTQNTIDSKLNVGKMKLFTNDKEINDLSELAGDDNDRHEDENDESQDESMLTESQVDEKGEEEDEKDFSDEGDEEESEENDELNAEEDEDDQFSFLKSKENMKLRASFNFQKNQKQNWNKIVYGNLSADDSLLNQNVPDISLSQNNNEDSFFTVKKPKFQLNQFDNSKYLTRMNNWKDQPQKISKNVYGNSESSEFSDDSDEQEVSIPSAYESIRDCFVTGQWDKDKDAIKLLDDNEMDEFGDNNEELIGDFEDFETGEVFKAEPNGQDDDDDDESGDEDKKSKNGAGGIRKKPKSEMTKRERLLEKKKRIKEQFDKEYDETKSGEVTESVYYDHLKQETSKQSELNRFEFEKLDEEHRIEYEGYKPGMYVRIEVKGIPVEFVNNFDPYYLAIVGCMDLNESNIGYIQVRLKKHRWHDKILKTQDPLIISLGWRRFQTIPIYFIQDHNMRNRYLKYTPQHMHCHGSFWGPITAQNTGFLAIQTLSNDTVSHKNKNFNFMN